MNDMNQFIERLGRHFERFDRRYFGGFEENVQEADAVEMIDKELVFGEEPELHLAADLLSVQILPLAAGEKARVVLSGRHVQPDDIEVGTRPDGAVTLDVHPHYGWQTVDFRPWRSRGHAHVTVYVPEGTRIQGHVNAGKLSVERLRGEFDLRTDAGKVRVRDCAGRLRLASGAGKVEVMNFTGVLEARADAGTIDCEELFLTGDSTMRANAGSVRGKGVRFQAGAHTIETSLGSIRLGIVEDAPLRIETSASLGSVHNELGSGPADAPVSLRARTELGTIRLYRDGPPATPLRSVPLTDERGHAAPLAGGEPANGSAAQPAAAAPQNEEETLRILGMVERHEITAGEAAALLSALRGGRS